jgi:diacylglycerol kinase family enzyme
MTAGSKPINPNRTFPGPTVLLDGSPHLDQGRARSQESAIVSRKVAVVINKAAGSVAGRNLSSTLADSFQAHGQPVRILTPDRADLSAVVHSLINEGFNLIVAGGGDGTVSSIAREVVGSEATLGVLPLGTLNHFARDLGVPLNIDEAVALICSGQTQRVKVASVNDHIFINNSSLGFYPEQVRLRKKWKSKIGTWPAMIAASIVVFTRFPYLHVIAEFEGQRVSARCPMLLVSNNEYEFEPGNFTQRDRLDKGLLGLYLLREESRTGLLRVALRSLVFSLEEAENFESHTASRINVFIRRRRVRVALDGEVHKLTPPLRYQSVSGGLSVIAPSRRPQSG